MFLHTGHSSAPTGRNVENIFGKRGIRSTSSVPTSRDSTRGNNTLPLSGQLLNPRLCSN